MNSSDVVIIGGGLAGTSVAFALSKRGISSLIIDRNTDIMQGASGNLRVLATPYFSSNRPGAEYFYKSSFAFLQQLFDSLDSEAFEYSQHGIVQVPTTKRLQNLSSTLNPNHSPGSGTIDGIALIDTAEASEILGITLSKQCLWYPQGGSLNPYRFGKKLIDSHYTSFLPGCNIVSYKKEKGVFKFLSAENSVVATSEYLVVASAYEPFLRPALFLEPVLGQVAYLKFENCPLRTAYSFGGYMLPSNNDGISVLASTYEHGKSALNYCEQKSMKLIELAGRFTDAFEKFPFSIVGGRAGVRASTKDKMPYIGLFEENLYVTLGHGSKGLLSCPIGGELIAASIAGDPSPWIEIVSLVNPLRFVL